MKRMNKNWRYPRKLTFTSREGLAGVPLVVLGHSVGTVGPNVQHTIVKFGENDVDTLD
jgi:hypothetical protein